MKYKVIQASSIQMLQQQVDTYILDGWECQGGISIACYRCPEYSGKEVTEYEYAQAMIRKA